MKNRIICFSKREKLSEINSCCNCPLYRNECDGALEINLFRQDDNGGYEIYQPLQELINKIARYLPMISTKKVLEALKERYDLKIDRTLLFKYHQKGLLEKKQKICKGRAGGVKTYWNDNAPEIVRIIKYLLEEFEYKLEKIERYFEFLEIKKPRELNHMLVILNTKGFPPFSQENKNYVNMVYESTYREYREFLMVATLRAFVELATGEKGLLDYLSDEDKLKGLNAKLNIDMDNIWVYFDAPINKSVRFKKEGIEVL